MKRIDPLFVDLYAGDGRNADAVRTLARAGAPWHGFWPKATEGLYYHGSPWLKSVWSVANGADDEQIAARLGVDWFTTLYHYFIVHQDPVRQAELFLRELERVGGMSRGYIGSVIDIEEANQRADVTTQQIIDGVSTFAERVRAATGKAVIRYSGWWLAGKKPMHRMGCDLAWIAAYTARFPATHLTNVGFDFGSFLGWQYCGDGEEFLADYPGVSPGTGPEDISAIVIDGGGDAALERLRGMAARGRCP